MKNDEKEIAKPPAEKPLTGAARDRARKAGAADRWADKSRKAPDPSKIQWQPKRGK